MISTKHRARGVEIMDDFSLKGEELRDALDKIARINRLLGGNKLTLQGVRSLMGNGSKFTIVDAGCGNGDMLRALADFGRSRSMELTLIGVDANEFTIGHARGLSVGYPEIRFVCEDLFSDEFRKIRTDITLCTLTLHHFTDTEILSLCSGFLGSSSIGIVVNDLHRSRAAYLLFKGICSIFRLNSMSREDGLLSILRGFKREDLERYSKMLKLKNYTIGWKWAFRYSWIIRIK